MFLRLLAVLLLAWTVLQPQSASACPLCKEAISTADADEEPNMMPAAYNNSIYLMVSVPYITLGCLSFLIYRGLRGNPSPQS